MNLSKHASILFRTIIKKQLLQQKLCMDSCVKNCQFQVYLSPKLQNTNWSYIHTYLLSFQNGKQQYDNVQRITCDQGYNKFSICIDWIWNDQTMNVY